VVVVLDRTPFYAEAGGQVGDTGLLTARGVRIEVTDTRRLTPTVTGHRGRVVEGAVRAGLRVRAAIDQARRAAIMRNHTATHLLHRALQEVLGEHARQAGSLVAPDRLRFDFTHLAALTPAEREAVERRVNEIVLDARPVRAATMTLDQAQRLGAMALFGEKYGERVRVVSVKGYSRELCGGTHVASTGQIGQFVITAESSAASGVRRIEAVTGWTALERARAHDRLISELAGELRTAPADLAARVRDLQDQVRALEQARRARADTGAPTATARVSTEIDGVHVEAHRIDGASHEDLRATGDRLRQRARGVFVLGGVLDGRVNLVAMVTPDLHPRGLRADAILRAVAARVGGTGGGKADLAQGGGRDATRLDAALDAVADDVRGLMTASGGAG
jgi:alanyl-tRNA synthetase